MITPPETFAIAALGGLSAVVSLSLAFLVGLVAMKLHDRAVHHLNGLRTRRNIPTDLDICRAIAALNNNQDHKT
ncbi:hypothetical protein [Streptomyces chartreusis]|uniref:hypothetical protein n=1 Tax=Streptomyces chartreusis TaxID=1969 RepID=UPI003681B8B4